MTRWSPSPSPSRRLLTLLSQLVLMTMTVGMLSSSSATNPQHDVERLAQQFREYVEQLKAEPQLELVFLVDASSSVGRDNFAASLRFVARLVSGFAVSDEATRVAVVTFGSAGDVRTVVDGISSTAPDETTYHNNGHRDKCQLLSTLIPAINYTGGGTHTRAALVQARQLLETGRKASTRAVILVTDGFSNGGEPDGQASELRQLLGVRFLAVGVRTGNTAELSRLAGSEERVFLLDSFEQFERLALLYNADQKIQGNGIFYKTAPELCRPACVSERGSQCTCGPNDGGAAVCACPRGKHGPSCTPCPPGTYGSPGGESCLPCPAARGASPAGAATVDQCRVEWCPRLLPPDNGYFVTGRHCPTVVHAACGVRCKIGYTLTGSSIRLCTPHGIWSGSEPRCVVRKCKSPAVTTNMMVTCQHRDTRRKWKSTSMPDEMPVDTECTFRCPRGRALVGSRVRTCLPLAQWDGLQTDCRRINHCPPLKEPLHGHLEPTNCLFPTTTTTTATNSTKSDVVEGGNVCRVVCDPGWTPSHNNNNNVDGGGGSGSTITGDGYAEIKCRQGKWTGRASCTDTTVPVIQCPIDMQGKSLPGKGYGYVYWDQPQVTDNAGPEGLTVWLEPFEDEEVDDGDDRDDNELSQQHLDGGGFDIGSTEVTYRAIDAAGNEASCTFVVTVADEEPPAFVSGCESPISFLAPSVPVRIVWEGPTAVDNDLLNVTVEPVQFSSHEGTFDSFGTTRVVYTARDASGNEAECPIEIQVLRSGCLDGDGYDDDDNDDDTSIITCEDGYSLALNSSQLCDDDGGDAWISAECTLSEMPVSLAQEVQVTGPLTCEQIDQALTQTGVTLIECEDDVGVGSSSWRAKREQHSNAMGNTKYVATAPDVASLKHLEMALSKSGTVLRFNSKPVAVKCAPGSAPHPKGVLRCVKCPRGHYSTDGVACVRCAKGTHARKPGSVSCQPRTDNQGGRNNKCRPGKCSNGGTCKRVGRRRFRCSCPDAFYGRRCLKKKQQQLQVQEEELLTDAFDDVENVTEVTAIEEETTAGDVGIISSPDPCELPMICENGGRCVSAPLSGYTCLCRDPYVGRRCSDKLNETTQTPPPPPPTTEIINVDGGNDTSDPFDPCTIINGLCENGGTCVRTKQQRSGGGFKCLCRSGYLGRRCNYLPCDYTPCPSLCQNLATGKFRCLADPCEARPCLNNGTCFVAPNNNDDNNTTGFRCACSVPYVGDRCETRGVLWGRAMDITGASGHARAQGPSAAVAEFSWCAWTRGGPGTLFSWATEQESGDNTVTLTADALTFVLHVAGQRRVIDLREPSSSANDWRFVCVSWESRSGAFNVTLDGGASVYGGSGLAVGSLLGPGGVLVVGQDQDEVGGGFSRLEAFKGAIAEANMWRSVLTVPEMVGMFGSCDATPPVAPSPSQMARAWHEYEPFASVITDFCSEGCPKLPQLEGGHCKLSSAPVVAECVCERGRSLKYGDGNGKRGTNDNVSSRVCDAAGNWRGPVPRCEPVTCPRPRLRIPNGIVQTQQPHVIGTLANYTCHPGFFIAPGNKNDKNTPPDRATYFTRTCTDRGTWSDREPQCLADECHNFTRNDDNEDYHDCHTESDDDDEEEPRQITTCPIGDLKLPEGGSLHEDQAGALVYPAGAKVRVTCAEGRRLVTDTPADDGSPEAECTADRTWHFHNFTCELIIKCGRPPSIPLLQLTANTSSTTTTLASPEQYDVGTTVRYQCPAGHTLYGPGSARCSPSGRWTKPRARCVRVSCGKPETQPGERVEGSSYLVGDEITVVCPDNPAGQGVTEYKVKCTIVGRWLYLGSCQQWH